MKKTPLLSVVSCILFLIASLSACGISSQSSFSISPGQKTPSASPSASTTPVWPTYNPTPRVDSGVDPKDTTNLIYHGGPVINGVVNIYLIFWIDPQYEQPTSDYIPLLTRFFHDVGTSPLYANLLQYTDSHGNAPTGARVAGSVTDQTTAFPTAFRTSVGTDWGQYFHQEVMNVATRNNWDYHNAHNLFFLFPIVSNGCGAHGYLGDRPDETNIHNGSPIADVYYPYANGQDQCVVVPQSPNHDHIADIAIGAASHELMEAVSDPYLTGWFDKSGDEMADKCPLPPATINPQTNGNVTWHGNTYLIQEEWDNVRHGCVLEGP